MANRQDLIDLMSAKHNILKKEDITFVVNSVFNSITEALIKKERVEIRHFGSFAIRKRKFSHKSSLTRDTIETMREIDVVYYRASPSVTDLIN